MSQKSKAISYALFGYGRQQEVNSFPFATYLRGLTINIRTARLVYPDWEIILQTDKETHEAYAKLFDALPIKTEIHQNDVPLTLAMLWRLRPIFYLNPDTTKRYTHVICRDLDSPCTYREAQAVKYWINRDKAAHAITDSISHDTAMLGGMIGFRPAYFTERMGVNSWRDLINLRPDYKWEQKGSDQQFLRDVIYPRFAQHGSDSITQHYIKGMPNSFLSDCHAEIQDLELEGVPAALKESNQTCGHIGAAGFYPPAMTKFLRPYWDSFEDIIMAEANYPEIFYWLKDGNI